MRGRRGPRVFRILVSTDNLPRARRFYERLLGCRGRLVAPGRVYFDAGDVILGVLARPLNGRASRSMPTEAIYFATDAIETLHRRAARLRCLSTERLHGDPESPMGEVCVRPWGERSFYAHDPSGNPLCFVDARTLFTGRPRQVAPLRRASRT
ncbi:MAG TPA: VOC family protein [Thermoplasmata archaeon]|nr:VOC family protein [Thermoplasmata archaeon]